MHSLVIVVFVHLTATTSIGKVLKTFSMVPVLFTTVRICGAFLSSNTYGMMAMIF